MLSQLTQHKSVIIKQRREAIEFIGFETRNKYEIFTEQGQQIGFAAEQGKGILGTLLRQIIGHWRKFDINIYSTDRRLEIVAHHPFRFYFQRLDVKDTLGKNFGSLEKQFSIFSKKFRLIDPIRGEVGTMYSGLFKVWTFPITKDGQEVARISKKWGGMLKEAFLDADTFLLEFIDSRLTTEERAVLLSAAIFIDLLYFENNQGFGLSSFIPGGE